MNHRYKIPLLFLSGLAAIGALLWMRSLASWRPTKIAQLGKSDNFVFLSSDERTVLLLKPGKYQTLGLLYKRDTATNKIAPWSQGKSMSGFLPTFSQSSPDLAAYIETKANQGILRIYEVGTGRLKRAFHWPAKMVSKTILFSPDGKTVTLIQDNDFFQWNIETGKSIRTLKLEAHGPNSEFLSYALSPDGTKVIGCGKGQGEIWSVASGKSLDSWANAANKQQRYFSPDARIAVYSSQTYDFVDTATGKVNWQTDGDVDQDSMHKGEIVLPRKSDCQVHDVFSGKIKRQLIGPRQSDGRVVRVTPDYIYILNSQNQILRWRAR